MLFQGTGGVSLTGLMFSKAGGCTTIITSSSDEKYGVDYTSAGLKPENPDVALLALGKGAVVRGIVIGSREQTEQLMRFVDQKKLIPPVQMIFSFNSESVKQAYQYLESQAHFGKICIKVD